MNKKLIVLGLFTAISLQAQSLTGFLLRSATAGEVLAAGMVGHTYTGVFTNRTDLIASAARLTAALEAISSWTPADLSVNSITYTNTYWDDSQVPATSFRVGTTAPAFDTFTDANIYVVRFTATQDDTVYGSIQLSHGYKIGTTLKPHVHFAPMTAAAGANTNVVWQFSHSAARIGAIFPGSTTVNVTNSLEGITQYNHRIVSLGDISGTGLTESSVIAFRLARLGSDAADTYNADVAVMGLDLHYEIDRPGSDTDIPSPPLPE